MTPKLIPLLDRCIEDGFAVGWRKAHKHHDTPTEDMIRECVREAIWLQLHEAFTFPPTDYDQ